MSAPGFRKPPVVIHHHVAGLGLELVDPDKGWARPRTYLLFQLSPFQPVQNHGAAVWWRDHSACRTPQNRQRVLAQ